MKRLIQILNWSRPKAVSVLTLVLCVSAHGQSIFSFPPSGMVIKQTLTLRLDVGDTDSAFFSLPDAWGDIKDAADSVSVDPPLRIRNSGVNSVEIQNIASVDTGGFVVDSTQIIVFGLNDSGTIIPDDSVTAGSTTVVGVYGDKAPHRVTLTGSFDNVSGFFVKIIHGDLTHAATFLITLVSSL